MNHYDLERRPIIREALEQVRDIPADQWHEFGFYDKHTGKSDLFGHFVRTLPEYANDKTPPVSISVYRAKAAPLVNAINCLLAYCVPEGSRPIDAFMICPGWNAAFKGDTPKDRAVNTLTWILSIVDTDTPPLNRLETDTTIRQDNTKRAYPPLQPKEPKNPSIPPIHKVG